MDRVCIRVWSYALRKRFPRRNGPILVAFTLVLAGFAAHPVFAQVDAPRPLVPDNFRWMSFPENPALEYAWVLGNDPKPGPYVLRVKLAAGGKIAPHTHPDERVTTVLEGTIYIGFGQSFDESKLVAIVAGAVCVIPAGVPHYVCARDRAAIYQETGVGATGTFFVTPPAPAR
jgi:quercetin dioxygenase-like cupin family protein